MAPLPASGGGLAQPILPTASCTHSILVGRRPVWHSLSRPLEDLTE